ncbi:hypothetical protein CIB95_10270 [Lottiidibacillus patelloidae]|uniref:Multidrug resistance efflux transporter family protein n=1 Tax=Lottiidibacillus patelloidae TaxID=2670334 RepID=A0A263BSA1_9BACI|nr:multidrug resistance efflux transporter family protein [Lottiidibacillus patelloidae]OZM56601.1 hypothetical protein CIB95_10270 [Lottiidibacillus patelloidae]
MKDIVIGILASMFFAVTFILNRSMDLAGGSWIWSSSLRFFFMLPFLFLIVLYRKNVKQLFTEMRSNPYQWILWSLIGFVLFYAPLTFAAAYGPGWLVAGSWQFTIVAGILLSPLFFQTQQSDAGPLRTRNKVQIKALAISLLIFLGVVIIQIQQVSQVSLASVAFGTFPVIIAAFAYPLGNRKMMEICKGNLDTFQRVLGMTIASMPFWFLLSIYGIVTVGPPSSDQITQTFIVAVSSGVIATTLFFIATDNVNGDQQKLAAVEATQSTQVLFVIIGEVIFLSAAYPNGTSIIGLCIIVIGMILYSFSTSRRSN